MHQINSLSINKEYLIIEGLSFHDKDIWNHTIKDLDAIFKNHASELQNITQLALRVKHSTEKIDPFIQQNTQAVCPFCEEVCCINKHSYYDHIDLIYIYAIGQKLPEYEIDRIDSEPCQFLGEYGCSIGRSVRPYRCNWFFCSTLLEHMEECSPKIYSEFIYDLKDLTQFRNELINEFVRIV